ncbi:MAG: antibiotic biosynthesis monooxygenase [Segetibacter sp.]|jgi:quinol monooxygenase YgiN|nr:antibiotic biosynthesis monooxygenase [Segetibacter sp.]
MKINTRRSHYTLFLIVIGILTSSFNNLYEQDKQPYVRIAKIEVDSAQLDNYKAALKEHAEAAVSKEPGVLTLYAVYDKQHPTNVTVFEIYASVAAYQSHIETIHFLKYKSTVKDMVKSLVLTDVVPITLQTKQKN